MDSSSRHMLSLLAFVIALGANPAPASAQQPIGPGIVVLHFVPSTSAAAGACGKASTNSGRASTLFREYRTADGTTLTITGQVALRFKASTSERQIDSMIAATGIEAFTTANRSKCRRYVFSLAHPEYDATAIANALLASGLVVYARPDLSAGRASEGITKDSFFVDPSALRAISANVVATDAAPAKYGMGQVLSEYTGPVMRVDGAALSAQLTGVTSSASAVELVRAHGITTLRVDIPDRSPAATVRVTLYSLNGTPVRQLVSEALQAGHYLVGWDGMDDKGRHVQPGVYVAVMTAGNFRETHRLVIR
jgi:flagellar hook capping protein FlgD